MGLLRLLTIIEATFVIQVPQRLRSIHDGRQLGDILADLLHDEADEAIEPVYEDSPAG